MGHTLSIKEASRGDGPGLPPHDTPGRHRVCHFVPSQSPSLSSKVPSPEQDAAGLRGEMTSRL